MSERPRFRIGAKEYDDVQFSVDGKEFRLSQVWADSKRLDYMLKMLSLTQRHFYSRGWIDERIEEEPE